MKTVLVVEDDPANLQIFTALLSSSGYHVLEATTGTEAIQAAKQLDGKIDFLLSDISVPERGGADVALELFALNPAMSILFVTGSPFYAWDRKDQSAYKTLPSDRVDVLEKPFLPAALLDKVGELLGRSTEPTRVFKMPG